MLGKLLLIPAFMAVPLLCLAQVTDKREELRRAAQTCDMRYMLLMLQVVNRAGAPVADVSMTLRRDGVPTPLYTLSTGPTGEVTLAEDGDLRRIPAAGSDFTVTLRRGAKIGRVKYRLGADEAGCHIALLSGPTVVTF